MIGKRTAWLIVLGAAVIALRVVSRVQEPTGELLPSLEPEISLSVVAPPDAVLYPSDPLLLNVALANPVARRGVAENAQRRMQREALANDQAFLARPQADRARLLASLADEPTPTFTIGSAARPAAGLIRVIVTDSRGAEVAVAMTSLARNATAPAVATLDARGSVALQFGLTPDRVQALVPGQYTIRAEVDTRSEQGMWQGVIRSRIRTFERAPVPATPPQDLDQRDYLLGLFHQLNDDAAGMEGAAKRLMTRSPSLAAGWELMGDGLASRGDLADAAEHYVRAMALYEEQTNRALAALKDNPASSTFVPESPQHLYDKLDNILRLYAAAQTR